MRFQSQMRQKSLLQSYLPTDRYIFGEGVYIFITFFCDYASSRIWAEFRGTNESAGSPVVVYER